MELLLRSLAKNEATTVTNKKLKNEIQASGGIAPDSLCVICVLSNAAYQRPDGVFVVPITALRN